MRWRRHDLVRAQPSAWAALVAERPDLAYPACVTAWAECGWPLVVRRPAAGDPGDRLALGLPLPPSAGKRRLAFALPPDAVGAPEPPPLLSSVAGAAPPAWRTTIRRLLALDFDIRVFGGLAWQVLTGLDYLTAASDLDLLWRLPPARDADARLAQIAEMDAQSPVRLDGELVRDDGAAANWRELASGCGEVLVKRLDRVRLMSRSDFLESRA